MDRKFKPWETAALLALCVTLLLATWAGGRQASIRAGLVRLHVIAASDDNEEQALKLRVRDAVLGYLLRFRIVELWGEIMNCIEP